MANEERKLPFFLSDGDVRKWTARLHQQRRIPVCGRLSKDSVDEVALALTKLDYDSFEPILLMIESGGGPIVPVQQLQDTIGLLNSPVDALVLGDCASAAVDLVQMCRKRFILPSARMLVHYIRHDQRWICDDPDQLDEDLDLFRQETRELAKRRLDLYTSRTGLSSGEIRKIFRQGEVHQAFFSANQALKFNFVDEILTNFKLFPKKLAKEKK